MLALCSSIISKVIHFPLSHIVSVVSDLVNCDKVLLKAIFGTRKFRCYFVFALVRDLFDDSSLNTYVLDLAYIADSIIAVHFGFIESVDKLELSNIFHKSHPSLGLVQDMAVDLLRKLLHLLDIFNIININLIQHHPYNILSIHGFENILWKVLFWCNL